MFAAQNHSGTKAPTRDKASRTGAVLQQQETNEQHNGVWQSLALSLVSLHPKLAISQPDDPSEREADRVAGEVTRMATPHTIGAGNHGPRSPNALRNHIATQFGAGEKLPGEQRSYFEPRFGTSLDHVRLHDNDAAHTTAASLNARAWTLGADVFFARDHYEPSKPAGKQLLAHELAHVTRHAQPPVIHRNGPTPAPEPLENLASRLSRALMFQDQQEALTAALAMAPRLTTDTDLTTHGINVITALISQNHVAEAEALLPRFERSIRRALSGVNFGATSIPHEPLPRLMRLAETTARGGNYELASRLFQITFLALEAQLVSMSIHRDEALRNVPRSPAGEPMTRGLFVYPEFERVYNMMRDILAFYHRLERDRPEIAGAALGFILHRDIRARYLLPGRLAGETVRTMTAEVAGVETPRGPGLRIFGANRETVDVTQLPGTRDPREVGAHSFQHREIGEIEAALYGQSEFMRELERQPEVRREFGSTTIDMNNVEHRLRIWQTMFRVYQRTDGEGALRTLMQLIGRYLRAFTVHTEYDIRDWGTSYLETPEPTDLLGRAERDCGVYALTVAYEVYRTARTAHPRLNLTFQLIPLPEHVALVIYDHDAGSFFLVNNDQVSLPLRGNVLDVVRSSIHREYLMTPGYRLTLGETRDPERRFRQRAWQTYLDSASWGFRPEAPRNAEDRRTEAERRNATYRRFYDAQGLFDTGNIELDRRITTLATTLARQDAGQRRRTLEAQLPSLFTQAFDLSQLFDQWARRPAIILERTRRGITSRMRGREIYVWGAPELDQPHPLARMAMALEFANAQGVEVSPQQRDFIHWCEAIGGFPRALSAYREARLPVSLTVRVPPETE